MGDCKVARSDVLVVDDDEAVRGVLCRVLRLDGHAVEAVPDGRSALSAFEASLAEGCRPAVVLDLGLPDLNGCEVLTGLLALDSSARILVLSGSDVGELRDCPEFSQAVALLQKPVSPPLFQAAVRTLLEQPKLPRRAAAEDSADQG